MKVLVTGASGFVGSSVCAKLVRQGHSVTAAVRKAGSAPSGTSESIVGDLGPGTDWAAAVAEQDAVVHLAARVHVMRDRSADPAAEFRRDNVEGTIRLARQAVAAGVRHVVFMSSIKASGESTREGPLSASLPDRPQDLYGVSKRDAEVGLRSIADNSGANLTVIRPALVYGPGVGGNILRLMRAIDRGIPLPLGSVHNHRSMIDLENLATLVEAVVAVPPSTRLPILAGDAESVSTGDVIRELAAGMGRSGRLLPFPVPLLRLGARLVGRRADIDRLVGDLVVQTNTDEVPGYSPVVGVREGLQRTGAAFRAGGAAG